MVDYNSNAASNMNKTTTSLNSSDGQVATVADIVAPTIASMGPMKVAQVETVADAEKVNLVEDPTVRNMAMTQLGRLDDRATGKVPTVSEAMFKQNLDRILKAQSAQASTTRGAQGSLLAQRENQIKANDMMGEAATTAAQLRRQEQIDADTTFMQAATNIRNLDLTKVIEQGKVDTSRNIANLNVRAERANMQANLKQQAYTTEYTTEAEIRKANANMAMQASAANQQKNLQTAVANAQNKTSMINTQVDAEARKSVAATGAAAQIESASISAAASRASAALMAESNKYQADQNTISNNYATDTNAIIKLSELGLNQEARNMQYAVEVQKLDVALANHQLTQQQYDDNKATMFEKFAAPVISIAQSIVK